MILKLPTVQRFRKFSEMCVCGGWSWCSGVWRRVEGCGGGVVGGGAGVVVCGGVWWGVEVV